MNIVSIPAILTAQYAGHMKNMHLATGLSEQTIAKYRDDYTCKNHAVIDGVLFTKHKCTVGFEIDYNVVQRSGVVIQSMGKP